MNRHAEPPTTGSADLLFVAGQIVSDLEEMIDRPFDDVDFVPRGHGSGEGAKFMDPSNDCLLYTSDAADD